MKNKEILDSVKRSMDNAPIDLLEKIKDGPRTKMIKHDEITKQDINKDSFKKIMPYLSVAVLFMFVTFGWHFQTRTPDSHIYIDVNPSIQIVTNRMNKVIDIRAENNDAISLIDNLNYKKMTINQLAEEILDRMMDQSYLDNDNKYLLFSVYNKNEEKAEVQKQNLDDKIHTYLQEKKIQPIILSQKLDKTATIEKYAKEYGVSVNKITFIRNLIILNPKLEIEDLVNLSIENLVKLSQDMDIQLDKIIHSIDFEYIEIPESEPVKLQEEIKDDLMDEKDEKEDDDDDDDNKEEEDDDDEGELVEVYSIISLDQAKKIALSIADGRITDIDYDGEDLEYEIEIELDDLEYEIRIDARTGDVLEVEIDD